MYSFKSVLLIATLITVSTSAYAAECDAILRDGVRNTYKTLQSGNFNSTFKQKFCDEYNSSKSGGSSANFGVTYKLFGANGGTSSQKMESVAKSFCSDTDAQQSNANNLDVLQSIADDNIVAAWSSCMSNQAGLFVNGELNGKTLVIEYRMRSSTVSTNTTTVKGNPTVINASCNDAVKDGTVIDTGGTFQTCTRETDDPVTIVVNTTIQSKRFFLPAINKEDVKKPEPAASQPPAECTLNCLLPENRADNRCRPNGVSILGSVKC